MTPQIDVFLTRQQSVRVALQYGGFLPKKKEKKKSVTRKLHCLLFTRIELKLKLMSSSAV